MPTRDRATSVSPEARVEWATVFGRTAPLVVEVGGGSGDVIAAVAARRPDRDFVAFEVFEPAAASTLSKCARAGVGNVRVVVANGVEGLRTLVSPASLAELWTFFPDPWHKKRHHKRRLVSPEFAALAASRLAPGGIWRLATDWAEYAESMRTTLEAEPGLANRYDGWAPRWEDRPVSRYEAKGVAAGRTIYDLSFGVTEGGPR